MATQKSTQAASAASVNQSAPDANKPHGPTTLPRTIPGFKIPEGARAVLVYQGGNGEFMFQPVARNESVLNLESELLKHLNEQPQSVEWLTVLRDYCDSRITATNRARATKSFFTPSASFDWDMTRIAALRGMQS